MLSNFLFLICTDWDRALRHHGLGQLFNQPAPNHTWSKNYRALPENHGVAREQRKAEIDPSNTRHNSLNRS
jgi:hypothetical protein